MNWILVIIGASLLLALFLRNKDRRYLKKNYKTIAPEEVKKYLNLKTKDAHFEKNIPTPETSKKRLSLEIIKELNKTSSPSQDETIQHKPEKI